ncbi:hypothetical protein GPX89_01980 [Nocardia sp. ET3-3]|uniref:Uncharacterized protein n=1 Tax=Nocardia terrae TaxID=2675851 RepID=A0A7K1UNU1_9NOCA|nr:hypothetical protein [Nocardia terrae]MVU76010.1 hypothetical protein [Nocardia terrae]
MVGTGRVIGDDALHAIIVDIVATERNPLRRSHIVWDDMMRSITKSVGCGELRALNAAVVVGELLAVGRSGPPLGRLEQGLQARVSPPVSQ